MNMLWKAALMAGAVAFSSFASADEAAPAPTEAQAQEAAGEAAANTVVNMTPAGDQVVTVNSGNEVVDAVANTAIKCAERSAAFKACDTMGGFKAMGCRKVAEIRYKSVQCPIQQSLGSCRLKAGHSATAVPQF